MSVLAVQAPNEQNWPRYLGLAITVFLTIGAFGHLGEELVAGITFIIALVEAYELLLNPVIELVRQILPDDWPVPSAYVFDFVILMNVAVRLLVWSQRVPIVYQLYQVILVTLAVFAVSYSADLSASLMIAIPLALVGAYVLVGVGGVVAYWRRRQPIDRQLFQKLADSDLDYWFEPYGPSEIKFNWTAAGMQPVVVVMVVGAVMLSGYAVKQINENANPSLDLACRWALAYEETKAELLASAGVAYTLETPGACLGRDL